MGLGDWWFRTSNKPKTGNGQNHPRLPAKPVRVVFRAADGTKINYPKKKK